MANCFSEMQHLRKPDPSWASTNFDFYLVGDIFQPQTFRASKFILDSSSF